eukprot:6741361-Prymnesium_polylepis.2
MINAIACANFCSMPRGKAYSTFDDESLHFALASDAEKEQIAAMRAALAKEIAAMACRHFPDVTGDLRLLRFLRGHDHSVPLAIAAVREMLALRRKYDMDAVHQKWAHVPCSDHSFPNIEGVMRHRPGIPTIGYSKQGFPIAYEPLRLHYYTALLEAVGEAGMLEFELAQNESRMMQLHELSEQQQQLCKMIVVIDCAKVGMWQLLSPRWMSYDKKHSSA